MLDRSREHEVGAEVKRPEKRPDLDTQLEDLFVRVALCERWARIEDRIDRTIGGAKGR